MTTYTSVFGNEAIPAAEQSYASVSLTADQTFAWPELSIGNFLLQELIDVHSSGAYAITLPVANAVSVGRSVTLTNRSAYTISVKDNAGSEVTSLGTGMTKIVYITDNSSAAGVWGVVFLGTGTSVADASALAGGGLKVVDSKLAINVDMATQIASYSVVLSDRARSIVFTGTGAASCSLLQSSMAGNGFLIGLVNQGTGSVTVDPYSGELVDEQLVKEIAPGESAFIVCNGSNWFTIGHGRSTQFQFTKLVFDISTGTPFTLTSTQAQNKLLQFIGTLAGNAIVNVPAVVAVYYVQCSYSGAYSLTLKTSSGAGVALSNSDRAIVYCDGIDVVLAQTSAAPATNLSGGAAGVVVIQTASNNTGFTAAGLAGELLESAGSGTPVWRNIGAAVSNLTSKTTPADADSVLLSDSAAFSAGKKLTWGNLKATLKTYFDTIYTTASAVTTQISNALSAAIGTTNQAYDANTAKLNVAQSWPSSQKSGGITDNDGSFDLSGAGNNYTSTPTSAVAITFTNMASNANKSGYLTLINSSAYAFTAHTNTKIQAADLTKIGATGAYVLPYLCDGTDVLILGAWEKP